MIIKVLANLHVKSLHQLQQVLLKLDLALKTIIGSTPTNADCAAPEAAALEVAIVAPAESEVV
jgi:hypothetical protein